MDDAGCKYIFKIPANVRGRIFLTQIRKHINREAGTLRVLFSGPRPRHGGTGRLATATAYRLYWVSYEQTDFIKKYYEARRNTLHITALNMAQTDQIGDLTGFLKETTAEYDKMVFKFENLARFNQAATDTYSKNLNTWVERGDSIPWLFKRLCRQVWLFVIK